MSDKNKSLNYDIRVSKTIERKMLCETFARLSAFSSISSYRYIGMGSYYFTDFRLFHRNLVIVDMVSMEWDTGNKPRFHFNRPFNCVEVMFGTSSEIIPDLSWEKKTILWLDYDSHLDASKLLDIKEFVAKAAPGSLLIVTLAADTKDLEEQDMTKRLEKIKAVVGRNRVPRDVEEKNLPKWGTAKLYRRIVNDEVYETLAIRNGGQDSSQSLQYKQLFNFHYTDGAKMVTTGGLIYNQQQEKVIDNGLFDSLNFIRSGEAEYSIERPVLTYKELRYLDSILPQPLDTEQILMAQGIPKNDVTSYKELYRYFPTFTEAMS